MKKKIKRIKPFDVVNIIFMLAVCATILIPFLHLLTHSFSPSYIANKPGLHLFPTDFTLENYKSVFENEYLWRSYGNTIFRTVVGTVLQVFFTAMSAYAISKPYFPHRSFWTLFFVFTMFFGGGLIPTYLTVRNLGLMDSYAALILPGLISAYNMVLMRNYFSSLPEELEESCMIDGAGRFTIFFKIVIPCSKPILATIALYQAVGHWNSWFDVLIYINDENKYCLQNVLRRILESGSEQYMGNDLYNSTVEVLVSLEGVKAATIFVAILPIMCVYPFVQKYFVKGVMMGSLKG